MVRAPENLTIPRGLRTCSTPCGKFSGVFHFPGGKVRVAVKCANRNTPIHRGEVWMMLQENAEVAA